MPDLATVEAWAEALLREHLDDSWSFGFDHAKKRAGQCNFTARRITLSRYLSVLHDEDTVRQTLLHEVAHALAGPRAGHGPGWRRIARELGYEGGATHRAEIASDLAPWHGVCPAGHETFRFRRPTRPASCARCSRRFDERHLFTWHRREVR